LLFAVVAFFTVTPWPGAALSVLEAATRSAGDAVEDLSVLAIGPAPRFVRLRFEWASRAMHCASPIEADDKRDLSAIVPRENLDIGPSRETFRVARAQGMQHPLFVCNLNQLRDRAAYADASQMEGCTCIASISAPGVSSSETLSVSESDRTPNSVPRIERAIKMGLVKGSPVKRKVMDSARECAA
jgi:hypothetical protein